MAAALTLEEEQVGHGSGFGSVLCFYVFLLAENVALAAVRKLPNPSIRIFSLRGVFWLGCGLPERVPVDVNSIGGCRVLNVRVIVVLLRDKCHRLLLRVCAEERAPWKLSDPRITVTETPLSITRSNPSQSLNPDRPTTLSYQLPRSTPTNRSGPPPATPLWILFFPKSLSFSVPVLLASVLSVPTPPSNQATQLHRPPPPLHHPSSDQWHDLHIKDPLRPPPRIHLHPRNVTPIGPPPSLLFLSSLGLNPSDYTSSSFLSHPVSSLSSSRIVSVILPDSSPALAISHLPACSHSGGGLREFVLFLIQTSLPTPSLSLVVHPIPLARLSFSDRFLNILLSGPPSRNSALSAVDPLHVLSKPFTPPSLIRLRIASRANQTSSHPLPSITPPQLTASPSRCPAAISPSSPTSGIVRRKPTIQVYPSMVSTSPEVGTPPITPLTSARKGASPSSWNVYPSENFCVPFESDR
uniref:Uncharacterized protein n=1 Tax=Knipowitschia caucasica TaxID=637954 RepID=A0AAV2L0T0_KNICA